MKISIWLFSLLSMIGLMAQSQSREGAALDYRIYGRLEEGATQDPVVFATVSVFQVADSALVTGGITDEDGAFDLTV
ncbi:MAG: hypothetical protein AAF597_20960, partial [Bacteroidota bacterium]